MAQRTINIGSSANKGDGDPIRTAFGKVNDNFTELYGKVTVLENGQIAQVQDTQGSIFADDSTLLVDAVNAIIPAAVISGTLNNNTVGTHTGLVVGDVTGSVFADDSTLLVDSVNGLIPTGILNGTISNNIDTASLRTSEDKIALGFTAGETNQGLQGIGIGAGAGRLNQNNNGIAIGSTAGYTNQGSEAVGVGVGAGYIDQGNSAVAIGQNSGLTTQGAESVAIGKGAGETTQGTYAQAIGNNAGNTNQGRNAVAIGSQAGETNQGIKAIALGQYAGQTNQAANSIVINATGSAVENTTASSLVIKPIRNATMTTILGYDATSGEVTHNAAIPGHISIADLKTLVAASTDFEDYQTRIAAL